MRMPIATPIMLSVTALVLCAGTLIAAPAALAAPREDALDFGSVMVLPAQPPKNQAAEAATYERCMTLARKNPTAAQKLAQDWAGRGGAHPAEHCLAVALIGLKQYKDAGARLEGLGQAMAHAPSPLRAEVFDQASQAWVMAGDPRRAYAAETAALGFAPDDADLLVGRAEAAGRAGWFDKAAADLERVLTAQPDRVDALIYRASAYRRLERLDDALADVEKALKLSPNSAEALLERGDIRRLKGDAAGARQDWEKVASLAPGSAVATAAKGNIGRLELK